MLILAIKSLQDGKYTDFDALTPTNCCHGMALYVKILISNLKSLDLNHFLDAAQLRFHTLQACTSSHLEYAQWELPTALIDLASLYILGFIRENDVLKGARTNPKKIKNFGEFSRKFCYKVINKLQRKYANLIAESYNKYVQDIPSYVYINALTIDIWGEYVTKQYLKIDKKNLLYAPCLFSMQIVLGWLIYNQSHVVLLNDIKAVNGELLSQQIEIYRGNGTDGFERVSLEQFSFLPDTESLVVFRGYSIKEDVNSSQINSSIVPFDINLELLILSCDLYYPLFPNVSDDPDFGNSPINLKQEKVLPALRESSKIKGVSVQDPRTFCLTHVVTASKSQLMSEKIFPVYPVPPSVHKDSSNFIIAML